MSASRWWIVTATLFIALVTHQGSRFSDSVSASGLVRALEREITEFGVTTTVLINDQDTYDPATLTLDRREVAASIDAELAAETKWRHYLDPEKSRMSMWGQVQLRRAYRRMRLRPPSRSTRPPIAGAKALRRLINIELSHLSLMRQAVDDGAEWVLIVEDDSYLEDPKAFANSLAIFMREHALASQPKYLNVSRSFDHNTLGIDHLFTDAGRWGQNPEIAILSADRPVTNTVCAILYRGTFLRELLKELESIPISPVLPIDWKLNVALMNMHNRRVIGAGDCWSLSPAPVIQRSMHRESNQLSEGNKGG